jgi:hypothetical protein
MVVILVGVRRSAFRRYGARRFGATALGVSALDFGVRPVAGGHPAPSAARRAP